MNKGRPDSNMEKTLTELEKHPALLKRCQTLYLEKLTKGKSYQELAQEYGVSLSTAFKYVSAYKTIAERYSDNPTIEGVLAFCYAEIARLLRKREFALTVREDKDLTSEIRMYQNMVNEISGLISRKAEVNVTVLNNVVATITEALPSALEANIGKTLTQELIKEILNNLAQKLEESSQG